MDDHAKLDRMYQTIAQTVVDMIPEEWTKVYVYGELMDRVQSTYFYYYPTESEESVQILEIPELFEVDEEEFEQLREQLDDHLENLWNEFKQNGHEPWSTVTMIFDRSGKFKVEYGYENLYETDLYYNYRMIVCRYKYLGLIPKDDYAGMVLEEYLMDNEGEED